ncbi:MAG: DUF1559 domain-containing protein [Isosphaeraceae bacterium]|nr:DUF1559 domain-containing protein [Isosphaeraceae bacterium]
MISPVVSSHRKAFTLVELLVSIGLITVLVGLLLPAVQAAREAARRTRCAANIKQLAIATLNFASVHGGFPSESTSGSGKPFSPGHSTLASLHCRLLGFLEQQNLYDSINFDMSMIFIEAIPPANHTVAATTPAGFVCPSDPLTSAAPYGCLSYRGNMGLDEYRWVGFRLLDRVENGAFGVGGRLLPLSEFTDGLSNTIAYSEKSVGSGTESYNPSRDWVEVFIPSRPTTPDGWLARCSNLARATPYHSTAGRCWILQGARYSVFFCSATPNSSIPDCGQGLSGGSGLFASRSYHPGGVNTAMADGSVRWFSSGIALPVWRALGTRAGGEIVTPH